MIGGLVGTKLLWAVEHATDAPLQELLLSRGALSWYGGLIGGVGVGLAYTPFKKWPIVSILAAATPALAFGHLIGRIGCFLVGDDYVRRPPSLGRSRFPREPPTTVPVHPTQLYEAICLGLLGWILIQWRRRGVSDATVLGRYLVAAGVLRSGSNSCESMSEWRLGSA